MLVECSGSAAVAVTSTQFHCSIVCISSNCLCKKLCVLRFFPQVHLELAKYNEMGRFTNHEPQMDCAMFHLEQAAACSVLPALVTMAEIYLQLPHEILASATVQVF